MTLSRVDFGRNTEFYSDGHKKNRARFCFTYEVLAEILGIDAEVINVIVDPTREIVAFVAITDKEEHEVHEGQEFNSTIAPCHEKYEGIECSQHFGHRFFHKFPTEDGYYELPVLK